MTQNRMDKYEYPISKMFKGAGITAIAIGLTGIAGDDSILYTLAGGSVLVTAYLAEAVGYMKGYLNERLNILEKKSKSSELEKDLE